MRISNRIKPVLAAGLGLLSLWSAPTLAQSGKALPFSPGETITYKIKKLKLTMGEATLVFNGTVNLRGRKAYLITLTADGFNFYDQEKIYLDPETFYPLLITRDLDIFGVEEQIVEIYHTQKGKVKIIKLAKGEKSEQVIEKGGRFDNIYGFIYRYRARGRFTQGEEYHLHLPLRDVSFRLSDQRALKAAGRKFNAYYMEGIGEKYRVYFDSGAKKIPLKIDGVWGYGRTAMIMDGYRAQ